MKISQMFIQDGGGTFLVFIIISFRSLQEALVRISFSSRSLCIFKKNLRGQPTMPRDCSEARHQLWTCVFASECSTEAYARQQDPKTELVGCSALLC